MYRSLESERPCLSWLPVPMWSTLPDELWKHVLQYLPQRDRLYKCSRVSRTLHNAAVAATQHVELTQTYEWDQEDFEDMFQGFCQWMLHHGQHLTSLHLKTHETQPPPDVLQLPCPNLFKAVLTNVPLQLGASSNPGTLHSCTQLQQLCLHGCSLVDGHMCMNGLSALPQLQRLELTDVKIVMAVHVPGGPIWFRMHSPVLERLQTLTALCFHDNPSQFLDTHSLEHLSKLTNLQELTISCPNMSLKPSTTPGISRLTALTKLSFTAGDLDPAVLQHSTWLQELRLINVHLVSPGDGAGLLNFVGRLQQLQQLQLVGLHCQWPHTSSAYATLTASSRLRDLEICINSMPARIWPHLFPPKRQLPAMRSCAFKDWYELPQRPEAALDTSDIASLISCCPGLKCLSLSIQPAAMLSALAQLSALTHLFVTHVDSSSVMESLQPLSRLAGLQQMQLDLSGLITQQSLLAMTTFTALTSLYIKTNPSQDDEERDYDADGIDIHLVQDAKKPTAVWLRLLKHCWKHSECRTLIYANMGHPPAGQQHQQQQAAVECMQGHTHQQQEEQQQQQSVPGQEHLQQLLAQQAQQIAELQEQLAAGRAHAAA